MTQRQSQVFFCAHSHNEKEIIREDGRPAENGIAGAPESQGERPDPQRYVNV